MTYIPLEMRPSSIAPTPYKKKKIPKALREALWISINKDKFTTKCQTAWCPNPITAYNFQAGHNIPESKGGATTLENLVTICARCNLSMGNTYSFNEWQVMGAWPPRHWLYRYLCCFEKLKRPYT